MASERSELSAAVVRLRNSFGESQQAFSNRLGMAINTLARYETSRSPSGYVLVMFEKLAHDQGLPEIAAIFGRAIDRELKEAGVNRGALAGSISSYFAQLLDDVVLLSSSESRTDEEAQRVREEVYKRLDWPRLEALKIWIERFKSLSELASGQTNNPRANQKLINQQALAMQPMLDWKAPFDKYFNRERESGADEASNDKVPTKKRKT